ncbi:RagB/SusD family nutrient uptake outer membrane protein [Longitalea luteola]|uniref:RagB/SusD family nutrient uptake outer membrane protein n=1 Tax=Longitalea luteola TaxID=2812563 RepID=UPI001A95787F|nr:RagB/SusD family nutrient uptake outer membrane protein [Longitalea luteola]
MKHYKFVLVLVMFINILASCKKDFLDVPDKTVLLRQAYVVDLKTTENFLNGIYVEIAKFHHGYYLIYPELIADNIKPVAGSIPLNSHYLWAQQADDSKSAFGNTTFNMNPVWRDGYRIIRECSFILETVDQYRSEDNVKADNIKGQAYALRALIHSFLVSTFAQAYSFSSDASHQGIPYITTSNWTTPVTIQTVAEVYESLISDLTNAIELLPSASTNALTMNRNAARAFLSRIYFFKGDYQSSKNIAKEVSNEVPIMTGSAYPSKLFTPQETEALFQLRPASVTVGDPFSTFFAGRYFASPSQQFLATNDIATILTETPQDVRKAWVTLQSGNWAISKYPSGVVPNYGNPASAYFQTLIRSSEIYLIAAESYAKLNIEDSARFYLDAIRKRANPAAFSVTASGQALLDSINKERRKELAFEGFRMYDLLRLKQGVKRNDALNTSAKDLPYPSEKAVSPIPFSDANVSGLPQNPGY